MGDPEREPPETRLINLCRTLKSEHPELSLISFRVERDDGDFQTYSIGERTPPHDQHD